ncbi:GAF modulated transcriptional regulator, LuxR family [Pseudonocardia thermophila]|uniref:GAF modulated transcriptional regulator, LuxR family n=1 Tax=Pseudonocardia thermophila TaxID=1848 RepID=A0A1M6Q4I2_PSETH|nr:LuxR C-terminal-related transcriptional regulator [Pseudonocardia thermophila]SHK15142.1 GAF modulated transcriptional regulator, LuxR family [Pseudonocardia thermophila]
MDNGVALADTIDRLLPERLRSVRHLTGLPVVFGGVTRPSSRGRDLVLTRLVGTKGNGLRNLTVPRGTGLGGAVLSREAPGRVDHYATATTITHEYDRVVVDQERLTGVLAVPVIVRGTVHGVLYAADRSDQPIGDRAMRLTEVVADQLAKDVERMQQPEPAEADDPVAAALDDLARLIDETADPALRARLQAIHTAIARPRGTGRSDVRLTPREIDVLRLVAIGARNVEIAARLCLSPETVRCYLRTAMRKLGVHTRTAAVHAARLAGAL